LNWIVLWHLLFKNNFRLFVSSKLSHNFKVHIFRPRNVPCKVQNDLLRIQVRSNKLCEATASVPKLVIVHNKMLIGTVLAGLSSIIAYHGLGYRMRNGSIEQNSTWSKGLKEKINKTYSYFGTSLLVTLCSAISVASSPSLIQLKMRINPLLVTKII